jgi:hypothetical protein
MNKRIIYPKDGGGIAIITPAEDCGLTIEEIAQKDVPPNTPYKIIDATDLPQDRLFREAWEYEF